VLEYPIKADFALIKAHQGDRWGTWFIAKRRATSARLWRPPRKPPLWKFAAGAPRYLDPESIITPGIFVQRVYSLENLIAAKSA
jgi:3-oxoadipate CoA-transferase alpha subunit